MKKIKRLISIFCILAICLCSTVGFTSAATGTGGSVLPNAQVPPGTDTGGGSIALVFTETFTDGVGFEFSEDYYTGGTLTSGTAHFRYYFRLYHTLAEVTHNYAFRAGLCYYNSSLCKYVPFSIWYEQGQLSGQAYAADINVNEFVSGVKYHGFATNLMDSGYVYGNFYFYRVLST